MLIVKISQYNFFATKYTKTIHKLLSFFRDYARKKWPLRGSQGAGYLVTQSIGVIPAAGQKNGRSDRKRNQVLKIPNLKHQILNKIKKQLFGILNFGYCDLFGICVLLFEIFYY